MTKTKVAAAAAMWLAFALGGCSAQAPVPADTAASPAPSADAPATSADAGGMPAVSCEAGQSVAPYLGRYETVSAERYRGGLTDEATAQARVGESVLVSEEAFEVRDTTIDNPAYRISCHPVAKAEGEVPTEKWSTFYGVATDRDSVKVLEVQDPVLDDEAPEFLIEILPGPAGLQLLEMYDGWIYRSAVK